MKKLKALLAGPCYTGLFLSMLLLLADSQKTKAAYLLDWSDPSTYTVTCGSVNAAQWTVKNDSCNYFSPIVLVGGVEGEPDYSMSLTIRINQSGNLLPADKAVVYFKRNGIVTMTEMASGDTMAAVWTLTRTLSVGATDTVEIRIALKTGHNTRFWQIKNNDVTIVFTPPSALPVTLKSFTGYAAGSVAKLKWTTYSEVNNDYFVVERSANATNFHIAAIIDGAGTTTVNSDYFFNENLNGKNILYYRLRQVDFNGAEKIIGSVVKVQSSVHNADVIITPNPAIGNTNINITVKAFEENVHVMIFDQNGTIIFNCDKVIGENSLSVSDMPVLRKGTYTVLITDALGNIVSTRLVQL